ncbi:hypothetical protein [Novosphingobium sp.]|uniref:hypothetical protein n=1 Tax=Novosphingobium sp. TaxID=1874826 RepID=UPI0027336378|nr:hypothetical protein [Novosphingobium sp.]MDP3905759.1 hypothetical protein [Novosphingobium sp.]
MSATFRRKVIIGAATLAAGLVAACGPKSVPPPPPPPPPAPTPVVYIPPRPLPPLGAAAGLFVPPVGPDGTRQTINTRLTPAQTIWNVRSAYNVAALNCLKAEHADVLINYKVFLKAQAKGLKAANTAVDADFRKRYGAAFIRPREAYMTQVYNYYAYPATLESFCDAATVIARESKMVKPAELADFSQRSMATLETVFETFYRTFEQYRADVAAWDAKYAPVAPVAPAAPLAPAPATATVTR